MLFLLRIILNNLAVFNLNFEIMKRLVLVMAIVFTFGVTYASSGTVEKKKATTEQTASKPDEKKKECCKKGCDKEKSGEKKTTSDKK